MPINKLLESLPKSLHYGVSTNPKYPLSSYRPITEYQRDLIATFQQLHQDDEVIRRAPLLHKLEQSLSEHPYHFNDQFPNIDYFYQYVLNQAALYDPDYELLPDKISHLINEPQIKLIKDIYSKYQSSNPTMPSLNDFKNLVYQLHELYDEPEIMLDNYHLSNDELLID